MDATYAGYNAGFYGLLVVFGVFFAITLFLTWWQMEAVGSTFYTITYIIGAILATSAFADYYTPLEYTAILSSLFLFSIGFTGFTSMAGMQSPDRFEGGANTLGRTSRLHE